ncbi:MAG: type II toxin-antitoxin system ParD family antitoxin [Rhizobiales bacterium]|nr:type II toxin-antitoxin system ParD family antitoxin [Hyphomicrobiales bacterium]MBO6697854.1 type II toxin-antitoxin system ParD family antitoxin [Hyphomicrobiales bacterium]MBO6735891.1 type II toxin-antitoxin system ParD family antitoxin [Hyphomicrobiales bacterium]MBO6913903.1 type II toxin-antitoxin system ParD family antitoxin [Hyphomicrobiales bacterium]MBO6955606.1 type II toxin-antitoxin system ParD family antitoxin [Hyphomicrobiales bacterium]
MATVDKRSISLTPELASIVDAAVAEGNYASSSEVVRDALREWKERRDFHGYTREEVRVLLQEGLASGAPKPWDKSKFLSEARKRLQADQDDS